MCRKECRTFLRPKYIYLCVSLAAGRKISDMFDYFAQIFMFAEIVCWKHLLFSMSGNERNCRGRTKSKEREEKERKREEEKKRKEGEFDRRHILKTKNSKNITCNLSQPIRQTTKALK